MNIQLKCKYCDSVIEVPLKWAIDNQRVFCNFCCKSFDVSVQSAPDEAKQDHSAVEQEVQSIVNKDIESEEALYIASDEDDQWNFYDGLPF
jgi:hypothetical protein